MTNSQPVREEQTPQDRKFLSVAPAPTELPLLPKSIPEYGNAGLLRERLNAIANSAPIARANSKLFVSPDFSLERGDTGLLLSQLDTLSNQPVVSPKQVLERGDTGLLLSALDALSNPPVTFEEFVLERGDTGLLLSELGALSNPPVTIEEFVLERGDTGLLLSELGALSNPPDTFEEFVLERGDTGLLLSELGALSNPPPAELMTLPREPNLLTPEMLAIKAKSYEPESSIFHPREPAPIIYTSDLDREFDSQKWLMILIMAIATLLLSCGVFSQLRSTTGSSHNPNVPPHPSKSQ